MALFASKMPFFVFDEKLFPLPFTICLFNIETVQLLFNPLKSTEVPTFRASVLVLEMFFLLPAKGLVHSERSVDMPASLAKPLTLHCLRTTQMQLTSGITVEID
jgi:hypothetical protein